LLSQTRLEEFSRKKFDNPSNSFLIRLKSELNDLLLELNNLDVYHIINSYNRLYTKYFKAIYTFDLTQYSEYKVLFEYIFRSINSYILDTPTSEKEKSSNLYFFINYCKVLSNDIFNNKLIVDSYNQFEKKIYNIQNSLNYIPPSVDKQIYILSLKNKKNLFDLLYKHFNLKNKLIINEYTSDIQTYELLKPYRKVYPPDTTNYRGKKRVSEISEYLNLITSGYDASKRDTPSGYETSGREPSYLDFGGGDGSISVEISKALQVKPDNSYCGDIIQWENKLRLMPYENDLTYINFKPYTSLDFDDNSLDFITAFQVFHHILDIDFVLGELYRVLKKGGYMLIREHDSETVYDSMLMDVEHSIYEYVVDDNKEFLQYYYAYYKSRKEWRSKLESVGFKRVNISDKNHMNKNPTKYYFEMYTKP
jgi:ubiquinone/menaquinone biosynthesis C-methylase UbiE